MISSRFDQSVQIETFKVLNNRRTPNLALVMMAVFFAYFNWENDSIGIVLYWILPNLCIGLFRAFFLFPYFDQADLNKDNVNFYLRLYTLNVGITGLVWSLALSYFFNPADPLLLLVFVFCYFILLVSGTIALSAHQPAFIAYWFPLFISLFLTFIFYQDGQYFSFGIGFLMFNAFILYLSNTSHKEIQTLFSLKFETQSLAESLNEEKRIAEKSVEDKNRFLAAASHDLRQPLHTVNLLLSALENQIDNSKGQNLLNGASNAMQALSNSFKSLLDVSKLDAGVVETNEQDVPLHLLIDSLLLEFQSTAKNKGVEIACIAPKCYIYSDHNLLERILRNLISNAVKYTNQGTVVIKVEPDLVRRIVRVDVVDTGVGIPDEELTNIFSEYYQLDNPERDRNKGFGLGLAISKRLCDLLNVPLTVQSKLGHGSTFSLLLQQGGAIKQSASVNEMSELDFTGATILVIDDDLSILFGMEKLLNHWGCEALTADSEAAAMKLLETTNHKVDLIIADYRLRNNKNGVDACFNIVEEFNLSIPSIIVTGDTSPTRLQEVTQSGFRILHKPVKTDKLKSVIAKSLT